MAAHQTHRLRPRNLPQFSQTQRKRCGTKFGVWEFEVASVF